MITSGISLTNFDDLEFTERTFDLQRSQQQLTLKRLVAARLSERGTAGVTVIALASPGDAVRSGQSAVVNAPRQRVTGSKDIVSAAIITTRVRLTTGHGRAADLSKKRRVEDEGHAVMQI